MDRREVKDVTMHWNGFPVSVSGVVSAHPDNWTMIELADNKTLADALRKIPVMPAWAREKINAAADALEAEAGNAVAMTPDTMPALPVAYALECSVELTEDGLHAKSISAIPMNRLMASFPREKQPLYTAAQLHAYARAYAAGMAGDAVNPVPREWIESGGMIALICDSPYGLGISYNCEAAAQVFSDFFLDDSRRLDWLESKAADVFPTQGSGEWAVQLQDGSYRYAVTLRAAIDAARSKESDND